MRCYLLLACALLVGSIRFVCAEAPKTNSIVSLSGGQCDSLLAAIPLAGDVPLSLDLALAGYRSNSREQDGACIANVLSAPSEFSTTAVKVAARIAGAFDSAQIRSALVSQLSSGSLSAEIMCDLAKDCGVLRETAALPYIAALYRKPEFSGLRDNLLAALSRFGDAGRETLRECVGGEQNDWVRAQGLSILVALDDSWAMSEILSTRYDKLAGEYGAIVRRTGFWNRERNQRRKIAAKAGVSVELSGTEDWPPKSWRPPYERDLPGSSSSAGSK